jgi:hypothetical protein
MSYVIDIKNALSLLIKGEWLELVFRLRVYFGQIDLKNASVEDVGLPIGRCHEYSNSGGLHLERVLDGLSITPQDSIIDFGSGKGGALMCFAKYPFQRITGIEFSSGLKAIAEENLRRGGVVNVEMIVCDAAEYKELDAYNYFYFFNPFPENIMMAVIENIEYSLNATPRIATIIYLNPEFHDTIVSKSSFNKIAELNHYRLSYFLYSNK